MKLMGLKVESYCIEKSLNENLYVQIALFYFMETLNGKLFILLLKFFYQNYREGKQRFKLKDENLTKSIRLYPVSYRFHGKSMLKIRLRRQLSLLAM